MNKIWKLAYAGTVCGAVACGAAPETAGGTNDTSQSSEAIHPNPGSTISKSTEANTTTGKYREVMYQTINGTACTATVVGPYAALTANHCVSPSTSGGSIFWSDVGSLSVSNIWYNPYLNSAYTPDWWIALNNAQKAQPGGRQDDWPAQHDQVILFVPSLTPQFMAQHGILPMSIDLNGQASLGSSGYTPAWRVVGTASTGSGNRDYIAAKMIAATPNTITAFPRDGYLTRDSTTANFGNVDPGDSGGPTHGYYTGSWLNGGTFEFARFIVGTTQNTSGDMAPLSYTTGIAETTNQQLTARLNALWANARLDDADGDGLPSACDSDPSNGSGSSNLCPAAIGGPNGSATTSVPVGQLACEPGYFPTGIQGRSGALIDQIQLLCTAATCLFPSGITACTDAHWTEPFGGNGGGIFREGCPTGQVLIGFHGTHDSNTIRSLGGVCAPVTAVQAGTATLSTTSLQLFGDTSTGSSYNINCGGDEYVSGIQTRTSDKRWTMGIQPICGRQTQFVGGTGGRTTSQTCPTGQVAVGTVQRAQGTQINVFGLLCASEATVKASATVADSELSVLRGNFEYFGQNVEVAASTERYSEAHLPSGFTRANCPNGYAVNGVNVYYGTTLNQIASLSCANANVPIFQTTVPVNVGSATGTSASLGCGTRVVDGMFLHNGWLNDGAELHCRTP